MAFQFGETRRPLGPRTNRQAALTARPGWTALGEKDLERNGSGHKRKCVKSLSDTKRFPPEKRRIGA